MNIAVAVVKKFDFFNSSKFKIKKSNVWVWLFVSLMLVLLNTAINFLQPSICSKYLPFLAIGCLALTARLKIVGLISGIVVLCLSLLFFFPKLCYEERIWQLSLYLSVALNNFIFLLCLSETEFYYANLHLETDTLKKQSLQSALDLAIVKEAAEDKERKLKEEIEKLKAEAEHRRIEKLQDLKKFELIQSEIEMLTLQKQEFVDDTRKAEVLASEALHLLEQKTQEFEKIQGQLKESVIAHQETILALQQKSTTLVEILEDDPQVLKRSLSQAEGLYAQLRSQFEEKTNILSQTRKDLFQVQTKCMVLKNENAESFIDAYSKDMLLLEKEIATLNQEIERLEIEISHLEELISHILTQ